MPSAQELVKQLGDKELAVAFYAFQSLQQKATFSSRPGAETDRRELAEQLVDELRATSPAGKDGQGQEIPPRLRHSAAVRNKILRLLSIIAESGEAPAISDALKDLETREMARFVLDRDPSNESTRALIAALGEEGPEFRLGVVNSLGKRKGADVLAALQAAANDRELEVRMAALEALSNLQVAANDAQIARAAEEGSAAIRSRAFKARIRLAESLRLAGRRSEASRIYRAVQASDADAAQKMAAEIGLKASS
jgi:hypothetical protein